MSWKIMLKLIGNPWRSITTPSTSQTWNHICDNSGVPLIWTQSNGVLWTSWIIALIGVFPTTIRLIISVSPLTPKDWLLPPPNELRMKSCLYGWMSGALGAIVVTNAPPRNPHGLLAEYKLSAEMLVAPDILVQEFQFVVIYSSLCILNWSPAAAFTIANWNRFVETTYVIEYWPVMALFVFSPVTKASSSHKLYIVLQQS